MSIFSPDNINIEGIHIPKDAFVVIVKTEWNAPTIKALEEGVVEILNKQNISYKSIEVPGAFEIPFAVKSYWDHHLENRPSAFIALGCVLRGDTPHFDYVCKAITDGVLQLNLTLPIPTIFGVLTVDSQEQIDERIGGKHGHKGKDAALTAIKMISLNQSFINH